MLVQSLFLLPHSLGRQHADLLLSDPAVTSATTTAQGGLTSAKDGIKTIAEALLTGQNAPADARTEVADGLTTAQNALSSINS